MKIVFLITDAESEVLCAVEDIQELGPAISETVIAMDRRLPDTTIAFQGAKPGQTLYVGVQRFVDQFKLARCMEPMTLEVRLVPKSAPHHEWNQYLEEPLVTVIPVRLVEHVHQHNVYVDGTINQQ